MSPRAANGKGLHIQFRLDADSDAGKRWLQYIEQGWNPRNIAERLLAADQENSIPVPETLTGQVITRLEVNVGRLEQLVAEIKASGGIITPQQLDELGDAITPEFEENMRGNVKPGFRFDDEDEG